MINSIKGQRLISYISPIYEQSRIMQAIFEAIGEEFNNSYEQLEDIKKQLFPQTATWGLVYWEQRLGLPTNYSESLNVRRGKVIAKLQTKYPMNPANMANIIKNYTGSEVLIVENVKPYTFEVIVDIDNINNNNDMKKIVNKIKPSHLAWLPNFAIKFTNKEEFNANVINRFNLNFRGNIPLVLDGTWLLNGESLLNGYEVYWEPIKVGSTNRFFLLQNEKFNIRHFLNLTMKTLNNNSYYIVNNFDIKPRNVNNFISVNKIKLQEQQKINNCNLRIEKNLWFLDGSCSLNGSKLLSAEIIEEVL